MRRKCGRLLPVVTLGCAAWLGVDSSSLAQTEARTALLLEPVPPGVGPRLLGQLGDLPWEIQRADHGTRTIERALGLSTDVVFWLVETTTVIDVTMVDVERSRALTRRFEIATDEDLATSGVRETAALFVRGSLEALAAGAVIGIAHVPSDESTADSAPLASPPPQETVPPSLAVTAHAGGTLTFDGTGPPASVAVGAGVQLPAAYLAVRGTVGLPVSIDSDNVSLSVARYGVLARTGFQTSSGPWSFELGGALGALFYLRETRATPADLRPTADSVSVALAVGAEAGLTLWLSDAFGLYAYGSLLGVVGAPELELARGDERVVLETLAPVQGTLAVALRIRIFP